MSDLQDGLLSGTNPEPNKRRVPEPPKPPEAKKPAADPLLNGKMTDETGEVAPVQMPVDHKANIIAHNTSLDPDTKSNIDHVRDMAVLHLENGRLAHRKALLTEPITDYHHEVSDGLGKAALLASVLGAALDPTHQTGPNALNALAQRVHESRQQNDVLARQKAAQDAQALENAGLVDADAENNLANQGFNQASQMQGAVNAKDLADQNQKARMDQINAQGTNALSVQGLRNQQTEAQREGKEKQDHVKAKEAYRKSLGGSFAKMMDPKANPVWNQKFGAQGLMGLYKEKAAELESENDPQNKPLIDTLNAAVKSLSAFTGTTPKWIEDVARQKKNAFEANKRLQTVIEGNNLKNKLLQKKIEAFPILMRQNLQKAGALMANYASEIKLRNLRGSLLDLNTKKGAEDIKFMQNGEKTWLKHVHDLDEDVKNLALKGNEDTAGDLKNTKQRRDAARATAEWYAGQAKGLIDARARSRTLNSTPPSAPKADTPPLDLLGNDEQE